MATRDYDQILRATEALTPDDQRRLIQDISDRLRTRWEPGKKRPRLEDLAGTAPYPLCGEDAQKWVSRTRGEADERRGKR